MKIRLSLLLLFFSLLLFTTSCEDEDLAPANVRKINTFIKTNMDYTYFWKDEMPNLNPNKQYDSEKYFNALLYDEIDQWSFITSDYKDFKNIFLAFENQLVTLYAYSNLRIIQMT